MGAAAVLRVALAGMEDAEDPNPVVQDAINENVVWMDNHLPRVSDTTGAVGKRKRQRTLCAFPYSDL